MKNVMFTVLLAVTIIVSAVAGYVDHDSTATNKSNPGGFSIILD
ncbi:hypothetical protein [Terribacillus sp. 7520-G]|nr:hypothetical protein [Terribacillus sp. 7520-G]